MNKKIITKKTDIDTGCLEESDIIYSSSTLSETQTNKPTPYFPSDEDKDGMLVADNGMLTNLMENRNKTNRNNLNGNKFQLIGPKVFKELYAPSLSVAAVRCLFRQSGFPSKKIEDRYYTTIAAAEKFLEQLQ